MRTCKYLHIEVNEILTIHIVLQCSKGGGHKAKEAVLYASKTAAREQKLGHVQKSPPFTFRKYEGKVCLGHIK